MFITAAGMTTVLAMGSLALDTANWYQKHHLSQVAADASALAAASCLAGESATATGTSVCTSPTDTTGASNAANSVAAANHVPIAGISYGTSTSGTTTTVTNVTVTTATTAPSMFARVAGISSTRISARSVAAVTWNLNDCGSSGNRCLLFYAASNSCGSSSSTDAIQMQIGNSDNLRGGVFSNGDINDNQGNGGNFWGPITYGAGSGCASNTGFKGATLNGGSPVQQTTDRGSPAAPNWPVDYSRTFTACSGSTCTGPGGTPSYCTHASAQTISALDTVTPNGVYCAYGSGTPSNPATWNGTISFPSGPSATVTLIAGNIQLNNNSSYSAYASGVVAYALGTGAATAATPAFAGFGGNLVLTGDIFAPNGGIALLNGNVTFTGFAQGQTIVDKGGNQNGAGPSWSGGAGISPGTDTLSQ